MFQARIQRPCSTVAARASERRPSSSSSSRCCSRRFSGDRDVPIDPRACSSNGANSSPRRGPSPPRQVFPQRQEVVVFPRAHPSSFSRNGRHFRTRDRFSHVARVNCQPRAEIRDTPLPRREQPTNESKNSSGVNNCERDEEFRSVSPL